MSRSWVDVDLAALRSNVKVLRAIARGAELCAVVKADGYGHGAVTVARAALDAGATRLAVAQVGEGTTLREAGFDVPIWVLSEPGVDEWDTVAAAGLEPTVYSRPAIEAATERGGLTVHLKVNTGMNRVGAAADDAISLAAAIDTAPSTTLGSVWTHLACADADPNGDRAEVSGQQVARFNCALDEISAAGIQVPLRHAANSGGTIGHPASHFDVVRCGIAMYGLWPGPGLPGQSEVGLTPVLTWKTTVSLVKRGHQGDGISYGHSHHLAHHTNLATIPVGYADGLRRGLSNGAGAVLINGRRCPIVGVVTMDQTIVDCADRQVSEGDDVVIIGSQGDDEITADDQARALGTINYEVVTGIGARVERRPFG